MSDQWKIRHDTKLEKYDAQFPLKYKDENDKEHFHPQYEYVKISSGHQVVFVKWFPRKGASGNEIYISSKVLKKLSDGTQVKIESATKKQFKSYKFWHDRPTILGNIGFILAIAGVIIAASVKLGEEGLGFIPTSQQMIGILKYAVVVLNIVGISLIFVKDRSK